MLIIITRWQIKANLNTEEGEKKYTRGKVRQIGRECVIWKIVNCYSVFQRNFDEYFSSLCLIFISSNRLSESIIKGVVVQPVTMNNLVRKTLSIKQEWARVLLRYILGILNYCLIPAYLFIVASEGCYLSTCSGWSDNFSIPKTEVSSIICQQVGNRHWTKRCTTSTSSSQTTLAKMPKFLFQVPKSQTPFLPVNLSHWSSPSSRWSQRISWRFPNHLSDLSCWTICRY